MTILFAPEAEEDFATLIEYLAKHNQIAAAECGRRIFAILDKLAERRFDGPEMVLTTGERVRSWAVPPVRIYDQRHTDALWVVRVYHQARSPIAR